MQMIFFAFWQARCSLTTRLPSDVPTPPHTKKPHNWLRIYTVLPPPIAHLLVVRAFACLRGIMWAGL